MLSLTWDNRLAYVITIGVALAHALVNFVFYVLPLLFLIGVCIAAGFQTDSTSNEAVGDHKSAEGKFSLWAWLAGTTGLTWCVFLLVMDVLSYGVFSAQDHVPYAAKIRHDPARMLAFANTMQDINGQRGIPVLGQARLLEVNSPKPLNTFTHHQIVGAYQRAMQIDPWNPLVFTSFAQFILNSNSQNSATSTQVDELLLSALQLNPRDLQASALFIDQRIRHNQPMVALKQVEYLLQWCELLNRSNAEEFQMMLKRLQDSRLFTNYATKVLHGELEACIKHPARTDTDGREPTALMRWLRNG